MKFSGVMAMGVWASCLLMNDVGVEAVPCCGLGAVAVGTLAFTGVKKETISSFDLLELI